MSKAPTRTSFPTIAGFPIPSAIDLGLTQTFSPTNISFHTIAGFPIPSAIDLGLTQT